MSVRVIQNSEDAGVFIKQILENQGLKFMSINHTQHFHRGTHIQLMEQSTGKIHHIKFAKEPFHSFGFQFPEYRGEEGETLNEELLDKLKPEDVLYFAYPTIIYKCTKTEFVKPNLWWNQKNGTKCCSFPLQSLEIFYEYKE